MEILLPLAIVVAILLIRRHRYRETTDVIDRGDRARRPAPSERVPQEVPPHPRPSPGPRPPAQVARPTKPAQAAPASAAKWNDTTPTPSGARAERSQRQKRACALVDRARREGGLTIKGPAYVIDGDTIIIKKTHIRLAGIDAPELDQPYGRISKSAMIGLCRGRQVIADIKPELSYDRAVAVCRLEDGTDLAEALVRKGLALDWRTFSGGRYRKCEPPDARKKLWKTALRQGRGGRQDLSN